jgi:hypothetical protein
MLVFPRILFLTAAFAVLSLPFAAQAQTPERLVKQASISTSGSGPVTAKWTCVSTATVELAPVSYDARGMASAWVMVYRDKGEIVAAERVSSKDAEQLRRLPCGTPDSDLGGVALVG